MWFKQITLYEILSELSHDAMELEEHLVRARFNPCLPSLPSSVGFAPPIGGDDAPLIHAANGYLLFCLQFEEKILPATVVRQTLNDRVSEIERSQDRKVYS